MRVFKNSLVLGKIKIPKNQDLNKFNIKVKNRGNYIEVIGVALYIYI